MSVIDTARGGGRDHHHVTLPARPERSLPDALAVAPDGETLYVANADNNCVAVVDVRVLSKSQVKVPGSSATGWYPTSLAVTPDGKRLLRRRGQRELGHYVTLPSEVDRRRVEDALAGQQKAETGGRRSEEPHASSLTSARPCRVR